MSLFGSSVNETFLVSKSQYLHEKKVYGKGASVTRFFVELFENLSYIDLNLSEQKNGDQDLYIDTVIENVPVSFKFYVEGQLPKLDAYIFNETQKKGMGSTIELPTRMLTKHGHLALTNSTKMLPKKAIKDEVNKLLEAVGDVTKFLLRKDENGNIVKSSVSLNANELKKVNEGIKRIKNSTVKNKMSKAVNRQIKKTHSNSDAE